MTYLQVLNELYSMRDKEHPDQERNDMIAKLDLLSLKEKVLPKDVHVSACQL